MTIRIRKNLKMAVGAGLVVAVLATALSRKVELLVLNTADFASAVLPSVLVDLANSRRLALNLKSLEVSGKLVAAAQMKADHMARNGYFAHVSPDGISPWHWFRESGYQFAYAGENLAVNFEDSENVNNAWMNSPAHRANILNAGFTEVGIATSSGYYKGKQAIFVVQLFAKPSKLDTSKAQIKVIGEQSNDLIIAENKQ